jgi:hypothetical protein
VLSRRAVARRHEQAKSLEQELIPQAAVYSQLTAIAPAGRTGRVIGSSYTAAAGYWRIAISTASAALIGLSRTSATETMYAYR